ncbi:hypothetical protein [Bacteriophage sp.]|nr:hypothetical protein [Bacteriophage sp.]
MPVGLTPAWQSGELLLWVSGDATQESNSPLRN